MEDTMSPSPVRALTATVVAVVTPGTRDGVLETLTSLARASGVRPVIVCLGSDTEATRREENGAIVIDGLAPRYLNNAVAWVRLSSLPTLAWCRAGDPAALPDLARLVDRVVMDREDPSAGWTLVSEIAPLAAVSDLRWARLTRWRDLIAQFFDMPEVRGSFTAFDRLEIIGTDSHDARLLAGWLKSRLPGGNALTVDARTGGSAQVDSVRLIAASGSLAVRILPNGICLETSVSVPGSEPCTRVVPLGNQGLAALLGEELRVRSRDLAFEDAVREAEAL
jgi:glucose-6-phosphate dehydrogenase assembly protein OpcA